MTKLGLARWYIDADTLGLAHVLIRARPDVTFPGDDGTRHTARWTLTPCPVQQTAVLDTEWIPQVTAAGMAIISRTVPSPDGARSRTRSWRRVPRCSRSPIRDSFALSRTRMTEIDLK